MEVNRNRHFGQNALGRWSHLQLWAILGTSETFLYFVICVGPKPWLDQNGDVSGSTLEPKVACPALPDQRAQVGAWGVRR